MFKIHSPIFWLVLGILWSVSVLLLAAENGFAFNIGYIPISLLAILSYITAIFMAVKRK